LEERPVLVRITTVGSSMDKLLEGQLKYFRDCLKVYGICTDFPRRDEVEKREKINIIPINMHRGISPIRDLISIFKVYRLLRKLKPKIVHSHTPKAGLVGMIAARLAGVPVKMHTVAGLPLEVEKGFKRKILIAAERFTYNSADMVYPNSYGLSRVIKKEIYNNEATMKIIANGSSNGINLQHFDINKTKQTKYFKDNPLPLSEGDFVYLSIGRIVRDKGVEELISAFLSIYEKQARAKLIVLGLFEERDPVSQETKHTIQSHPGIIYCGFQQDVRPYLSIADVFVFPSYREGLPNVVLQAGAYKLPIIGTNITGTSDIIIDKKNGILIPPRDVVKLKENMSLLLDNEELRKKYSLAIYETISSRYDQKIVWEALLQEYKELIRTYEVS
jgi:glycosyltransferase involved in cell wall biosynthesis